MVNDPRNLFQITRILNQAKKTIPWADYLVDATIRRYLAFGVPQNTGGWDTVEGSLKNLVTEMINHPSAYNTLTRYVGERTGINMRW